MKKTHETTVPFIRQEKITSNATTIAIVKFVTNKKMTPEQCVIALTKVITEWIRDYKYAKEYWRDSNETFNIGDLVLCEQYLREQLPHASFTKNGLVDFDILYCSEVDGAQQYDRILVNDLN